MVQRPDMFKPPQGGKLTMEAALTDIQEAKQVPWWIVASFFSLFCQCLISNNLQSSRLEWGHGWHWLSEEMHQQPCDGHNSRKDGTDWCSWLWCFHSTGSNGGLVISLNVMLNRWVESKIITTWLCSFFPKKKSKRLSPKRNLSGRQTSACGWHSGRGHGEERWQWEHATGTHHHLCLRLVSDPSPKWIDTWISWFWAAPRWNGGNKQRDWITGRCWVPGDSSPSRWGTHHQGALFRTIWNGRQWNSRVPWNCESSWRDLQPEWSSTCARSRANTATRDESGICGPDQVWRDSWDPCQHWSVQASAQHETGVPIWNLNHFPMSFLELWCFS